MIKCARCIAKGIVTMIDPPCVCHVCGSSIDLSPEEARKYMEAKPELFAKFKK